MEKELTEVYCGNGKGKTALAIGQSLRVATPVSYTHLDVYKRQIPV